MEPMIQEERAFSKMRTSAVQRLQNHLPMEIAAKSGALFHSEKKCLEIQSLNQRLEISLPEYDFTPYIEEWHQLVILHYLDLADGVKASKEQVSFGGLKDGLIRGTKFDHYMDKELRLFLADKSPEQILKICKSLGAEMVEDRSDLCAVFPFLPHYPIWLKIWFADEEFDTSGKMLLSKNADHYLTIEDAVTVGDILLSKLKSAVNICPIGRSIYPSGRM